MRRTALLFLVLSATTLSAQEIVPSLEKDPTVRVLSPRPEEQDESKIVKAAKAAAEARAISEAKVTINQQNLKLGGPVDRATGVSGRLETATFDGKKVARNPAAEAKAALDEKLATTPNVKVIATPREREQAAPEKTAAAESSAKL